MVQLRIEYTECCLGLIKDVGDVIRRRETLNTFGGRGMQTFWLEIHKEITLQFRIPMNYRLESCLLQPSLHPKYYIF